MFHPGGEIMVWLTKENGGKLAEQRSYLNYTESDVTESLNLSDEDLRLIENGNVDISDEGLDRLCRLYMISRASVFDNQIIDDLNVGALLRNKGGISERDVSELENFVSFLSNSGADV